MERRGRVRERPSGALPGEKPAAEASESGLLLTSHCLDLEPKASSIRFCGYSGRSLG